MTTRLVLAIDTSTPRSVVALARIDAESHRLEMLATDEESDSPNQVSAGLVPRMQAVLHTAAVAAVDIDLIACGRGPGTFTGTRVAIATAKGWALGLGIRIVPISTLAAIAATAATTGPILATIDARRGELYGALFEFDRCEAIPRFDRIGDEQCVTPEILRAKIAEHPATLIAGSGTEAFDDDGSRPAFRSVLPLAGPGAVGLVEAAAAAIRTGLLLDPAELQPVYLRQSYAELGINTPRRPVLRNPALDEI